MRPKPVIQYHIPHQINNKQENKYANSRQIHNITYPITFIQHNDRQKSKQNSYINNINLSPLKQRKNDMNIRKHEVEDDANKFDKALKKNSKIKSTKDIPIKNNNFYALKTDEPNNLIQWKNNQVCQSKNNENNGKIKANMVQNNIRQFYSQGYQQQNGVNSYAVNRKDTSRTKKTVKYCSTHRQRLAEFKYIQQQVPNNDIIDDGLYYCSVCARKLLEKGFQLQKIFDSSDCVGQSRFNPNNNDHRFMNSNNGNYYSNHTNLMNNYSNNNLNIPNSSINIKQSRLRCSKYAKSIYIQQAENLTENVLQLKQKYEQLMAQSQSEDISLNKKYSQHQLQIELVQKYYQKIIQIVTQYKIKHISKLRNNHILNKETHHLNDHQFIYQQNQQNPYWTYMQKIKHNLSQLETMTVDLTFTDFDKVMEKLTEDDFQMCFDVYRNKVIAFIDDYDFITNQIRKVKWQQQQAEKDFLKNIAKSKNRLNKCLSDKVNVKQIQQTIDKIQKQIRYIYDPSLKKQSKPKSSSLHKFITQFQKENNTKMLQNPKSLQTNQTQKQNLFKIFQKQNKENVEIISPQFKKL